MEEKDLYSVPFTEEEKREAKPMEGVDGYNTGFKDCINKLIQAFRMNENVYIEWPTTDGSTVRIYSFDLQPYPQIVNDVYEKVFGRVGEYEASDFWMDEDQNYTIESDIDLGRTIIKEQLMGQQDENTPMESQLEHRMEVSETLTRWEKYVRENEPSRETLNVMVDLRNGKPLSEILKVNGDSSIDIDAIKQFGGEQGKKFVDMFVESRSIPKVSKVSEVKVADMINGVKKSEIKEAADEINELKNYDKDDKNFNQKVDKNSNEER